MLFILFRHFRQAAGIVEAISEYIYIVLSIPNIVKHCLHVGHSTQQQSTARNIWWDPLRLTSKLQIGGNGQMNNTGNGNKENYEHGAFISRVG